MPNSTEMWWEQSDDGDHAKSGHLVLAELNRIRSHEGDRRRLNAEFVRWYGDTRYNGLSSVGTAQQSPDSADTSRSNENVIRETITTAHNKFAKNKPVPTIVTVGGTYQEQREATERENWIRGAFEEDGVYPMLAQGQFGSMCFGDGFLGVRDDYDVGRPVGYHVPAFEIHVDSSDAANGKPRAMYRVGSEAKEVLIARYPEYEDEIDRADPFLDEFLELRYWNNDTRQVQYVEAWHLPSRIGCKDKPGSNDGRHVVCLGTVTLLDEEWECDYFPLVKMPWNPTPIGYFSVGLIEDLIGPQRQMNRVRSAIDRHLELLSSAFWAIKKGSNVVKAAISNLIGRAVDYNDTPPQLIVPDPISPSLVEREDKLRNQIFAQSGVSQMSSQSLKPAGLNSGKALRTYADQEDQRFANAYIAKEDAVVALARLYCKRAQAMLDSSDSPGLKVKLTKDSQLLEAEWSDCDIDSFRVLVLPSSSLSTTLAGRIEDIEDLIGLGLVTSDEQKRQLLQMPDLKADSDLSLAPRGIILKTLQTDILEKGKPTSPEPFWDLQQCSTLGLQVLCFAQLREYPEERIQLLRNWIAECVAKLQPTPAPPAPPGPPQLPPGAPDGAPMGPMDPNQVPPGMPPGVPMPPGPIGDAPIPAGPMPGAMQ